MFIKNQPMDVKALRAEMVKDMKHNDAIKHEYELAFADNNDRYNVLTRDDIANMYDRMGQHRGASKAVHDTSKDGVEFKYIVVKRVRRHPLIQSANQIYDECNAWISLKNTDDADCLAPVFRYHVLRGDRSNQCSANGFDYAIEISQKAEYVGDYWQACKKAEIMNSRCGCIGESALDRQEKILDCARRHGWWDIENGNSGNCGVVLDHSKGCYKAVIIDYAL